MMCKIISDIVYTFSFLIYYEVFEGASVRKKRFWVGIISWFFWWLVMMFVRRRLGARPF